MKLARPAPGLRGRIHWGLIVALMLPLALAGVMIPGRTDRPGRPEDHIRAPHLGATRPAPLAVSPPPTTTRRAAAAVPDQSAVEESPSTRPQSVQAAATEARLQLTVVEAGTGTALPGAHIELIRKKASVLHQADESGQIELDLRPGDLTAFAWSGGHTGGPFELDVQAGATQRVLALGPGARVEGRVINARDGSPIADASVCFWTHAEQDIVVTDANGEFSHPRFPREHEAQQLRFEANGFGPVVRYLEFHADGSWIHSGAHAREADLRGFSEPARLVIGLLPATVLKGRVLDESGRPVSGAKVSAEGYAYALPSLASQDFAQTVTDESGRFELGGLREDVGHAVSVRAPGHGELIREIPAGYHRIRRCANPEPGDLGDLRLVAQSGLAGVLIDPAGDPVRDARVRLSRLDMAPPGDLTPDDAGARIRSGRRSTRTDDEGAFSFDELGAGEYEVTMRRDRGVLARAKISLAQRERRDPIYMTLADDTWTLRGRVQGEAGPAAGVLVEFNRFGRVGAVRTDDTGAFRMSGLDEVGTYSIRVLEAGFLSDKTLSWAWESPLLQLEAAKTDTK